MYEMELPISSLPSFPSVKYLVIGAAMEVHRIKGLGFSRNQTHRRHSSFDLTGSKSMKLKMTAKFVKHSCLLRFLCFLLLKFLSPFQPRASFVRRFQFIRQLFLAEFAQNASEFWSGLYSKRDQFVAGQQRRADLRLLL